MQVWSQDELDAARDRGDAAAVAALLRRRPGDAQDLFVQAIRLAAGASSDNAGAAAAGAAVAAGAVSEQQANGHAQQAAADGGTSQPAKGSGPPASSAGENGAVGSSSGSGWQWYVYSYISAFLARRAEFLASCAEAGLAAEAGEQQQQQQQIGVHQPGAQQASHPQPWEQQPAAEQQAQQAQPLGEQQAVEQHPYWQQAVATYAEALEWAAKGGAVLAQYRFHPATGAVWRREGQRPCMLGGCGTLLPAAEHACPQPLTRPHVSVSLFSLPQTSSCSRT